MYVHRVLCVLGLAVGLISTAAAGVPYPRASTPAPAELGTAQSVFGSESITVTVALQLRNTEEMESLLSEMYTPGSSQSGRFLSQQEFSARFGPAPETVQQVMKHYQSLGLQVTRASTTLLKVTGSTAAVQSAFGVGLQAYEVPAQAGVPGFRYRAATSAPQIPADIAPAVQGVLGLDTRPRYSPHIRHVGAASGAPTSVKLSPAAGVSTPDAPGLWTVTDFAQYYDVDPLYQAGIKGRRQTIGIVTLASFTPSDAFTYWNSLGLTVSPNRIHVVNVDGGAGPPSDVSGSDETTLDVEQSGGLAPAANMVVYVSPNTDQGFIDAFAAAFDADVADTVSVSWGTWEFFDTTDTVQNPNTGRMTTSLRVLNDLFFQAALQGQSVYASAGDAGAYDVNRGLPVPFFTKTLSVDSPASLPFVTAAGGTTLPGTQTFLINPTTGQTVSVTVPTEQAWGWDYLTPVCTALGLDPVSCGIFPGGGGGGVSVFIPRPLYQFAIPAITNSAPGQALIDETQTPPQLIFKLPANFPGRNVPDISANADPETGYVIFYTSDQNGFEILTNIGGTSFVAPQLNGVTALLDQGLGHRVGLLNFALYDLLRDGAAYSGRHPPMRDIVSGDNWFYTGHRGYDQASGLGVLDVTNLLRTLAFPF